EGWSGADPAALLMYTVVLVAGLQVLTFPLDFYSGYVLERRFELGRQKLRGWLFDWLKAGALEFALIAGILQGAYAFIHLSPELWWAFASVAFVLVAVILAQLAPVLILPLFARLKPLEDEVIRERLLSLSKRLGVKVRGVYVWGLGEKSRKANAALTGWGYSRRILLSDTLLAAHSPDEVEVIIAHEIAHQVNRDIWRGIAFQAVASFVAFYLISLGLATWAEPLGFRGPGDVATVPLLLLIGLGIGLVALPVVNAFSRGRERAADAYALRVTGMAGEFASAMEKLAALNLSQRRPNRVVEFIFHSHPATEKRIEFARAWAQEQAGAGSPSSS
ncbi:MAG: M48 family metalloprotease, partial [Chloroflexi bacterium]|nr:M48 family metalloprotease [Chloroflexota bacterium]